MIIEIDDELAVFVAHALEGYVSSCLEKACWKESVNFHAQFLKLVNFAMQLDSDWKYTLMHGLNVKDQFLELMGT